ncbi:hypothetical protein OO012_02280 [Rhodobacteraceae bacterium KMM 6894]|nr:hypothetical protein [Rhodobacteraceae bacterium KMM 6894]
MIAAALRRCLIALALMCAAPLPGIAQDERPLAIGLAPVNDWSTQQPFLDVMKTARRWIGHVPGQWGGVQFDELEAAGLLDAEGWPTRVPGDLNAIGTVILTDLPEQATALAGRYRLTFEGEGIVEVSGRGTNKRYRDKEVTFDFTPGQGPVEIRIQRSDPRRTGDYVRNIRVVHTDHAAELDAGAVFRPDWLTMLDGFEVLRFMDWMTTNNSEASDWDKRPQISDFSYTRRGVPLEVMLDLAETVGADAWFNMPHLAGDAYVRAFAQTTHAALKPGLRVYVEYSNEVWNWQFAQAEWADAQGQDLWGIVHRGAQFYGLRAAEVADIWAEEFVDDRARLTNVIATQTGWLGIEADILTAPLAVADGFPSPVDSFDAYAVTGYFGHVLGTDKRRALIGGWLADSLNAAEDKARAKGLSGAAFDDDVAAHRYDLAVTWAKEELQTGALSGDPGDTLSDLLTRVLPYHAKVAARFDLDLMMYEGGTHVVGLGAQLDDDALTDFFVHLNYTPEMGALYGDLLDGWAALSPQPFNVFTDIQASSKWGSWGAKRWPGDDNPRWRAIESRK